MAPAPYCYLHYPKDGVLIKDFISKVHISSVPFYDKLLRSIKKNIIIKTLNIELLQLAL